MVGGLPAGIVPSGSTTVLNKTVTEEASQKGQESNAERLCEPFVSKEKLKLEFQGW
jgi:hypothetical protein